METSDCLSKIRKAVAYLGVGVFQHSPRLRYTNDAKILPNYKQGENLASVDFKQLPFKN